jgi:hypothetical protein
VRHLSYVLSALFLITTPNSALAGAENTLMWNVHVEEFKSSDLKIIEAALPGLQKARPSWTEYRIKIVEIDNSFLVDFWRPEELGYRTFYERPISDDRVIARMPLMHGGVEIELDKKTLHVINVLNIDTR